jgi:hypothetical protein
MGIIFSLLLKFGPILLVALVFWRGLQSCAQPPAPPQPMTRQAPVAPPTPGLGLTTPRRPGAMEIVDTQSPADLGNDAPNRPSAWQEAIMSESAARTWQWGRGRLELTSLTAEPEKTVAKITLYVSQDDTFLVDLLGCRLQIGASAVTATATTFPHFQKDWPLPTKRAWTTMDARDVKTRVLVDATTEYEVIFPFIGALPDISAVYLRAVHVSIPKARFFLDKEGHVKDNPFYAPLEVISLRWPAALRKRLANWHEPEPPLSTTATNVAEVSAAKEWGR